jgi:hypothetical protein
MFIWISENTIAGTSDSSVDPADYPQGFRLVEYEGDRVLSQLYWDGQKICEKPDRPSETALWSDTDLQWLEPQAMQFSPGQNWLKLTTEFQFPGNLLYASVLAKVSKSGFVVQDHWQNFKLLLSNPNLQTVEALASAIAHLDWLLSEVWHPLDNQDKASWNRLMEECGFPIECQLSNAPR